MGRCEKGTPSSGCGVGRRWARGARLEQLPEGGLGRPAPGVAVSHDAEVRRHEPLEVRRGDGRRAAPSSSPTHLPTSGLWCIHPTGRPVAGVSTAADEAASGKPYDQGERWMANYPWDHFLLKSKEGEILALVSTVLIEYRGINRRVGAVTPTQEYIGPRLLFWVYFCCLRGGKKLNVRENR